MFKDSGSIIFFSFTSFFLKIPKTRKIVDQEFFLIFENANLVDNGDEDDDNEDGQTI